MQRRCAHLNVVKELVESELSVEARRAHLVQHLAIATDQHEEQTAICAATNDSAQIASECMANQRTPCKSATSGISEVRRSEIQHKEQVNT